MALLKKKEFDTFYLRNVSVAESPVIEITDSQLLLGRSEKSDIVLNSDYVNHYHAVITYVNGALFISDLCTVNGTRVNGKKVRYAQLNPGDLLEFGDLHFEFGETTTSSEINDNNKLELIKASEEEPELPPIPSSEQLAPKKGQLISDGQGPQSNLFYIDGEYCDIKFDEKGVNLSHNLVIDQGIIEGQSFIEEEQRPHLDLYGENEEFAEGKQTLEVIFASHGNILSYDIIPQEDWGKADHYLSSEIASYVGFENPKDGFISYNGNQVTVNCPIGFTQRGESVDGPLLLKDKDSSIVFEKGVHQVFVRYSKQLRDTNKIPPLWKDKEELKSVGKRFLVFFLPFLLLTLVEIKQEEKKKNVVVIYKKKIERKEKKQSLASDSKQKDSPKKEEARKISENKSDISNKNKTKKTENRVAKAKKKVVQKRKRNNKVAKSGTKGSKKVATSRKKRPQLKLAANFSKMLGSSQFKSKSFSDSSSSSSSSSGSASGLSVAQGSSLSTVGGGNSVKGLGSSSKYGNGKGYKSNGLGKSGFDSSFTSTKTVVVGAIDPDILRRLLREHIPQFRYCYQEELGRNSDIKGIIDLNFTINGRGKVANSDIQSKNGKFSRKGIGCITQVLKRIPFPKPKGGGVVEVKQPLNFSSEKTKV